MNGSATKTIAFVLYPGLTPLDLVRPLQALSPLSRIDPTFEVVVVGERTDVAPDRRRHPSSRRATRSTTPRRRSRSSCPEADSPRSQPAATNG